MALAAAVAVCACSTPAPRAPAENGPSVETAPDSASARPGARGRLKPMPVRPLNVRSDCRFTDETGYSASAVLDISDAEVHAFSARVDVPRHGGCRFDLADFTQVRRLPHVELRDRHGGCTVSMWEQGEQVTIAFSGCARRCTHDTFDHVWPILLERAENACH